MNVIDFFCGCGGTSLGFQQAGLTIAVGIDFDPESGETYRRNFPNATFLLRDVTKLSIDELRAFLPPRPWLFSGCAPCQPFSRQNGLRSPRDPRRALLDRFGKFVEALRPDYAFVENVPGLQRIGSGGPLGRFQRTLKAAGYTQALDVLPALWFGVPQQRERLVLIAARSGAVTLPEATHGPGRVPYTTVRDWIDGLRPLKAGATDPHDGTHRASALSPLNLKRIKATPEGKGRQSWPKSLVLNCHRNHGGHSDVYGRLAWDRPAAGLTTRCISLSNGRFGHPVQNRALSAREAACLQTFPRDYIFHGTLASIARQIGNAVPPLMACRIGQHILDHYTKNPPQ